MTARAITHVHRVRSAIYEAELELDTVEEILTPPPHRDTTPSPAPVADESGQHQLAAPASSRSELPILAGEAELRVSEAMNALVSAVVAAEKLSMALARFVDSQRTEGGPRT